MDDEVYEAIQKKAVPLLDSPNSVLRRVLLDRIEWRSLRRIVVDWLGEGFLVPPYPRVVYDLIDHFEITQEECHYDLTRPQGYGRDDLI